VAVRRLSKADSDRARRNRSIHLRALRFDRPAQIDEYRAADENVLASWRRPAAEASPR